MAQSPSCWTVKNCSNAMLNIETLPLGPLQANCYIVSGDDPSSVVVIDPGDDVAVLRNSLHGRTVAGVLVTHAHFDHMGAAMAMKQLTGAPLYISKEDAAFIEACEEETYIPDSGSHVQHIDKFDFFYDDDTRIELGNISIRTMLTPGHTIGCTSFFWEEKNPVTGDVYTVAIPPQSI